MKTNPCIISSYRFLPAAGFFLCWCCALALREDARAVTKTWDGSSSSSWSIAANWTNGVAPVNGDGLLFPLGAANLVNTNNSSTVTNFTFITISGSNYVLQSGHSLSITNGLTNSPEIANTSNNLSAAVTVRANQTWANATKSILTLRSNVTLSTFQLTFVVDGSVAAEANVTGSAGSQFFKDGGGQLELDGAANFLPDLRVRDGTLLVDGVLAGGLTISNGAALIGSGTVPAFTNSGSVSPGVGSTPGVLTVSAGGATRFNSGSLTFQLNGLVPGTDHDQLKVSAPPDLTGATLGVVRGAGFSPLVGDRFIIITNTGAAAFTTTFLGKPEGAAQTNGGVIYTVSYTNGSRKDVTLTVAGYNFTGITRTWSGAGTNSLWLNPSNWVANVAPNQGDNLSFPIGAARLTNTNDFPAGSMFNSISFSGSNYVINGSLILINTSLTNTPPAATANTFACPLMVVEDQTIICASGTLFLTGNINILSPSDLGFAGGGMTFATGVISGDGSLTIVSAGTLVLSASNTFAGTVFVDGALLLQDGSALGSTAGSTFVTGTLTVQNGITVPEPVTLSGTINNQGGVNAFSGNITLNATNATFAIATNSQLTLSGALTGSGGLIKIGPGTLKLAGTNANTYAAATLVNEGLLFLNKTAGTNAIPGDLIIGDGLGGVNADFVELLSNNQIPNSATVTINSSGRLDLNGLDETIGPLTMDGGTASGTGGTLTLNGDVTCVASGVAGFSTITGKLSLGGANRTFTILTNLGGSGMNIAAVISDGSGPGGLTKAGAGPLFLTAGNTYSGPTIVAGGTLTLTVAGGLGAIGGGTVVSNGVTLQVAGGITVDESNVTLFGTLQNLSQSNSLTGTVTLASSNATVLVFGADVLTLSGELTGTGGLVKDGFGLLQFSGSASNSFSGTTAVNEGTLLLNKTSSDNAIPGPLVINGTVRLLQGEQIANSAPVTINDSGLLDLNNLSDFIGSLAGTAGSSVALGSGLLTPGGNNASTTFAGLISGTGGLQKIGAGRLTLSGNNTYTGQTVVNGGTLLVNGNQPGSPIFLNTSTTLGGTGTVGIIQASVSACTISPGASPGILTSSGVAMHASTIYTVELNGTNAGSGYDQLNVAGTVDLGNAALSVSLGFTPVLSNSFTIIKNDLVDGITGIFSGKPEGTVFAIGAEQFLISYAGGDGNDVVLTQVSNNSTNRPSLTIESIGPKSVRLLWPAIPADFSLQTNSTVVGGAWNFELTVPVVIGTNKIVTNIISDPQKFYRLICD